MKKSILLTALILVGTTVFAQTANPINKNAVQIKKPTAPTPPTFKDTSSSSIFKDTPTQKEMSIITKKPNVMPVIQIRGVKK